MNLFSLKNFVTINTIKPVKSAFQYSYKSVIKYIKIYSLLDNTINLLKLIFEIVTNKSVLKSLNILSFNNNFKKNI